MEKNQGLKVEAGRSFPVSADQLYKAWTDPEQLKQWWKPMGNTLQNVTNDIRQGGTVRYVFADNKLNISGEYLEVKENEKLVYTWKWELPNDPVRNADYMLTVEFKSSGNGSDLRVLQENFEDEESLYPHQEGWEKGLSELEQFLSGGGSSTAGGTSASASAGGTQPIPTGSEPEGESGGYRETPDQVKVGGG